VLEVFRIAGAKNVIPDDVTKTEIADAGKGRLVGSYKVCIGVDGLITSVSQLNSTGVPAYDAKIIDTIRSEWRYRPFVGTDGKPERVCTAVTFIYAQQSAPPPPRSRPWRPRPPPAATTLAAEATDSGRCVARVPRGKPADGLVSVNRSR